MCSAPTKAISSRNGDMYSVLIEEKPSRLFATAARPPSGPCGRVRRVRAPRHLVQFLPQQALSKMPGHGARQMAGRKGGRVVAGPVFPRSIYGASKHRWPGTPECAPDLSHSISRGIGNVLTIAADPKHLGASIGFLAVLHTWGQNLHLHPHLHCVIPGGGISPDGASWVGCRKSFFLPVRVLSRLFRSKFLIYLRKAFREGKLRCHGEMAGLAKPGAFEARCREAGRIEWVVYAKPPCGGPEQVLKYLARYTHRVAIANRRLLSMEDGRVTFEWKDYAGGNQTRMMTLDAVEFIRRFLLHIVPAGFVRIRQFGFLANRARRKKLALCRALLAAPPASPKVAKDTAVIGQDGATAEKGRKRCPVCQIGHMIPIMIVQPAPLAALIPPQDSS